MVTHAASGVCAPADAPSDERAADDWRMGADRASVRYQSTRQTAAAAGPTESADAERLIGPGGQLGPVESSYQQAAQRLDQRIGLAVVQVRNWWPAASGSTDLPVLKLAVSSTSS